MHIDDAHDDKMVAEETALQVHTRAQLRAAQTVSIIEATSASPSPEPTADTIVNRISRAATIRTCIYTSSPQTFS